MTDAAAAVFPPLWWVELTEAKEELKPVVMVEKPPLTSGRALAQQAPPWGGGGGVRNRARPSPETLRCELSVAQRAGPDPLEVEAGVSSPASDGDAAQIFRERAGIAPPPPSSPSGVRNVSLGPAHRGSVPSDL